VRPRIRRGRGPDDYTVGEEHARNRVQKKEAQEIFFGIPNMNSIPIGRVCPNPRFQCSGIIQKKGGLIPEFGLERVFFSNRKKEKGPIKERR